MPTIPYKNAVGQRVSGVTTIISGNLGWNKQALMYWAWNEGMDGRDFRQSRDKAADAGTIGHYLIDCHVHNREPETKAFDPALLDLAETCLLNFITWADMFAFHPLETEIHLVSEKHQYGATPDCVALVNGKLSLLDWKTGNGVYADHLIQLAAYKAAWEEVNSNRPLIGGFHLLRIGKEDASFHHHHWAAIPEAWIAFQHLLELNRLKKKLEKMGG